MKIAAVVGSMRKNGNTELLTDIVLQSAQAEGAEVTKIVLQEGLINGCDACDYCIEKGICKKNDLIANILNVLLEADAILLASPVYFWSVSAQMKALLDRTHPLRQRRQLRGKIAGFVVVARRGGTSEAFSLLNNFANLHRMHTAGGVMAYGDNRGDVLKDKVGVKQAEALGRAMVKLYNICK